MLHNNNVAGKREYVSPTLAKFEFSTQDVIATSTGDLAFVKRDTQWTLGITIAGEGDE